MKNLPQNPGVGGIPASDTRNMVMATAASGARWPSPANPAAFDATERKAATGTGAPSYVSGAQNWNGNAETLNANPATTNRIAASAMFDVPAFPASAVAMPVRRVVWVTP